MRSVNEYQGGLPPSEEMGSLGASRWPGERGYRVVRTREFEWQATSGPRDYLMKGKLDPEYVARVEIEKRHGGEHDGVPFVEAAL